jgi:hypothetical protein
VTGRRVVGVVLAGLLLGSACGCGKHEDAEGEATKARVPVHAARVEIRTIQSQITATGQWRAADSIVVIAPFTAYVETIRPHLGDRVAKGETIGTLVTHESRAALRGAEILLRQASGPAERQEAERALAQAERGLVRVPLAAAATGTVIRRSAEPGSEVAESAPLLTLVPQGSFVFEAHVAHADAGRVQPGQRATIHLEGTDLIPAVVQRRLPQASESDQNELVWLSPARVPTVVLDRFGTAALETGAARSAPAVPDSALVEDDLTGEVRIARVAGGVAIWTPVRLGQGSEGWHELLAPRLVPGTLVVISGQRGLPDSTRVEIAR